MFTATYPRSTIDEAATHERTGFLRTAGTPGTPQRRSWGVALGRDHDLVRFEPNTAATGRSRQRSDFLLLWLIKSFSRGGLGHLAAQG